MFLFYTPRVPHTQIFFCYRPHCIDRFTIVENGRTSLTLDADEARAKFRKLTARFPAEPPALRIPGVLRQTRNGRELELITNGTTDAVLAELRKSEPEDIRSEALSLEEIFVVASK